MGFREHSLIYDTETGVLIQESHRLDGKLHRDEKDGPALRAWSEVCRELAEECYYWNGRRHRDNGPAELAFNSNGSVHRECYYRHGSLHRDPKQGPALIERNVSGTVVVVESYYVNGRSFRDPADGPYHINRDEDGRIADELYSSHRSAQRRRLQTPSP
jgi:hypothetical protein